MLGIEYKVEVNSKLSLKIVNTLVDAILTCTKDRCGIYRDICAFKQLSVAYHISWFLHYGRYSTAIVGLKDTSNCVFQLIISVTRR